MSELEMKTEAEAPEFTDEPCDELSDEALDRCPAPLVSGSFDPSPTRRSEP